MVLDADRVPGRRRVPVYEAGEAGGQVARTGTDVQHLAARLQVRLQQLQCVRVLAREMENVFDCSSFFTNGLVGRIISTQFQLLNYSFQLLTKHTANGFRCLLSHEICSLI